MINSNQFKTEIISLSTINDLLFCIPTYQRPYVWEKEQISKLLSDCINSFKENPEKPYYLGTILTDTDGYTSELIDGQQRFTTLWLLAFCFNYLGIKSELSNFLKAEDKLRLGFEIRIEIKEYFELLLKHPDEALNKYSEKEIKEKPYLKNIVKAITIIQGILKEIKKDIDLSFFGNYLYEKVLLVNNTTPKNIDLNKLFSTINNSGIQLEQTDIVKANLLKKVTTKKVLYSKIWESCENMNDYFERNIFKTFNTTNKEALSKKDFFEFNELIFSFENKTQNTLLSKGYTISQITNNQIEGFSEIDPSEKEKSNEVNCRSIINFGQLLLHTFRIYLYTNGKEDFEGTFHVNRLIQIFKYFENTSENEVKNFIELLWKVRATFDFHIIKWITDLDSKEVHLECTSLQKQNQGDGKVYFNRNVVENKSEELMLQSVLYFAGDYLRQFWLTPYLYKLIESQKEDLKHLEYLDNELSLSKKTDKNTSYLLMDYNYEEKNKFDFNDYLKASNGTSFKHYWFQKLEYILWKEFKNKTDWENNLENKFKKFRISSKNSVEHIFPQKPKFQKGLNEEYLHNFGNLVLLSVIQNSEYSRKSVEEKSGAFFNKPTFDSLKSFLIFKNYKDDWNEASIEQHQEEVIKLIQEHYNKYISQDA